MMPYISGISPQVRAQQQGNKARGASDKSSHLIAQKYPLTPL